MAISTNDEQLARKLLSALHRHGAGWVAAEVEAERDQRTDYEDDVRMLLVAISQSLGMVPELVTSSAGLLAELDAGTTRGVIIGDQEVAFDSDTLKEMTELERAAETLRAPIADLLRLDDEVDE